VNKEWIVMAESMQFPIGSEVSCADGPCGELTRVVIDPIARVVTDLVVEPKHRVGLARLVPLTLVEAGGEQILLRCSLAEFEQLERAEETDYLPGLNGGLDYAPDEAWTLPYYGLGGEGGLGSGSDLEAGAVNALQPVVYDRIPLGEVDVRRGESVQATDGAIGKVQGVVIDPKDRHVTHVLLQEGHLWGKKEVAIPSRAVVDVTSGVHLSLTKDEVRDLPPVEISQL
jgi:sporulation protein YlmC with PRC-barrel domain